MKMRLISAVALFLASSTTSAFPAQNPDLAIFDLTEGKDTTVEVSNNNPGDIVRVAASLHGPGPTSTIFGMVDLTPPWMNFPPLVADAAGVASMTKSVPAGTAGVPVWIQAVNVSSGLLSNSLAEVIAPDASIDVVFVPAGTFVMGDHFGVGRPDELPLHSVTVDGFWMDQFEVTNAVYANYLNAAYAAGEVTVTSNVVYQVGGAGQVICSTTLSSIFSRIVWSGSDFSVTPGKEDHPMVDVSWYGSCAYANWRSVQEGLTPCYDPLTWGCNFAADGLRLPTEAEWEYAARGGAATATQYHWGNTINDSHANYFDSGDPFESDPDPKTTPVGYYDGNQIPAGVDMANAYGLYDMSGNMVEWCNDWYDAAYYASSPAVNPTGPATGTFKVTRGGSWDRTPIGLRSAWRAFIFPFFRFMSNGFRLVSVR